MKAYTDTEQSKKLVEILPVESADMYWLNWHIDSTESKYEVFVVDKSDKHIDFFNSYAVAVDNKEIIPCWSLAALIETMPEILIERVKAQDGYDGYYYFVTYEELIEVPYKKELIDACVEMILKLHEEKLI